LTITNTTANSYILYFSFDNYGCGFTVNKQEVYLGPNESLGIELRWAPAEETTCSATLLVTSGWDTLEEVPVVGTAIPPDQAKDVNITPEVPGTETIRINGFDTGVEDRRYGEENSVFISELFASCEDEPTNHGEFVRCVAHVANHLKKVGLLDQKEQAAIKSLAARPAVPSPQFGEGD
jgi:hypothetical protein